MPSAVAPKRHRRSLRRSIVAQVLDAVRKDLPYRRLPVGNPYEPASNLPKTTQKTPIIKDN